MQFRISVVALVAIALAAPSFAGQVNLSGRVTVINETISSTVTSTAANTITLGTISGTNTSNDTQSVTRNISITETFLPNSAAVSFEVAQDDVNYTSPFDNTFVGTAAVQTLSISAAGLSNVNAVVGAGNVTVASNGILNGAVLGSITGSAVGSLNAGTTEIAVATLTPGFALQNSNANALTLAAASAIAGAGLGGPGIALDIQQSGLNEYSPHGNVSAFGGSISQSITVSTAGIANVGAAAGAGNVQAAHSLILYSAGSTINLSVVTQ